MNIKPVNYSIIMPVYNGRNYFADALMSAIYSSGEQDEIVVIEDGSNDGGVKSIVENAQDYRVRYFQKDNGGVASALNYGLRVAQNPYFCWLSHDDLFLPNRLEEDRKLRMFCSDIVTFSSFYLFGANTNYIRLINRKEFALCRHFATRLLARRFMNGCTVTAPISKLKKFGFFDEELRHTQDYDMWLKILQEQKFSYIEAPTVMSRQHRNQDSKKMPLAAKREFRKIFIRHRSKISFRASLALDIMLLLRSF